MAPLPQADMPSWPRILLADDNPDNMALIALFLEETPYRLETVTNGREAVDRHAVAPYALIFMDLEMPGMDGYEATLAIRALEQRWGVAPIPILALTAHALPEHRQRCRQAGFTDFLVKPVRRASILEVLSRYLGAPPATPEPSDEDRPAPKIPDAPDRDRLRPLLPLFFTTCEEALATANLALTMGDLETARFQGHRLKGSAHSFGFREIGLAGEALERAGGDGDTQAAQAAWLRARDLLALARRDMSG